MVKMGRNSLQKGGGGQGGWLAGMNHFQNILEPKGERLM